MTSRPVKAGGFALIHAILFMVILSGTLCVITSLQIARLRAIRNAHEGAQAFYLAEAGVAVAASRLAGRGPVEGPFEGELGAGSYRATIERGNDGAIRIRSTGRVHDVVRSVTVPGRLREGRFRATGWESR